MGYPLNHPIVQTAIARGLISPEQLEGLNPQRTLKQSRGAPAPPQPGKTKLVTASFNPPACWLIPLHVVAGDNQRGKAKIARAGHERRTVCRVFARYHRELAPFADVAQAGALVRCKLTRFDGQRQRCRLAEVRA